MRHHVRVGFDLLEYAVFLEPCDDLLARRETVDTMQRSGARRRVLRQIPPIGFVIGERDPPLDIENVDLRQVVALADFEVVEVVRRCDLDCARSLLRIGVFVRYDWNLAPDQRQDDVLADQMAITFVVRMHCDRSISEHGFRPRCCHDDESRCVFRIEGFAFQRIAQIPQASLDLGLLDLNVRNCGEQFRVPIDQPLVLVDQTVAVQFHEHLGDRT